MTKTLPAPADELTPQQQRFVDEYARTGNASASYRTAFDTNHAAVRVDACRLLRVPAVAARLAELRAIAADAINTSVAELALQCFEIATASVGDLQRVEIYNCRHCNGDGHRYQWDTIDDFSTAMESWLATKDNKPQVRPSYGGVGFNPFAPPADDCPKCLGAGVPSIRTVPTAELSPGARMLYAGAAMGSDGQLRVMTEDRPKYRDMLHKLIGAYAPTRVEGKHAHLHLHRQAPDTRQPMTADEAIALLEQPE